MTSEDRSQMVDAVAEEAFALLDTGRQVSPFSSRHPGFDLSAAYEVVARVRDMRVARGEHPVGRKIGFTNSAVWSGYGISGPIWNYLFDSTVHDLATLRETFDISRLPEPRIEPELVLHLGGDPRPGMSEDELIACVDWVAHGFEVVFSIFPDWRFTAADAAAAYGVHGALLLGERHRISGSRRAWRDAISGFAIRLTRDDGFEASGHARNVLGGPLSALRFLNDELARFTASEPLRHGETVTTGTLTEAVAAIAGESWSTRLAGIEMEGIRLMLV